MRVSTLLQEGDVALVQVEGEIDAHTARELERALKELLDRGHSRLVLDLEQVSYVSSAGLRIFLWAQREARGSAGEVRLFGLAPSVRRVFELAGFDRLLGVVATRQDAFEGW